MTRSADEQALFSEALNLSALVEHGIAGLERMHPPYDDIFSPLLLLASGVERLCKITLWLRAFRAGSPLTLSDFKKFSHQVKPLVGQVVTDCFSAEYLRYSAPRLDYEFLKGDANLRGLLDLVSEFGESGRYYHLNLLVQEGEPNSSPSRRWRAWDDALVRGNQRLEDLAFSGGGGYAYYYAVSVERRKLVERFLRAICRLYSPIVLDAVGVSSPSMLRWAELPDEALGKTDYNLLVRQYDVFNTLRGDSAFSYQRIALGQFPASLENQ